MNTSETTITTTEALQKAVQSGELIELHTSRRRGYVSRRNPDGVIAPYSGRFGEGYTLLRPCYDSTQYTWVTYYVRP